MPEHTVKTVLSDYGIRATNEQPCDTLNEALAAAEAIGWPVALKGFGADLIHKSDEGAVALDLAGPEALHAAWDAMSDRLGSRLDGLLVAEMASGEVEAILGIQNDAQFGPVLLVGLGGVLAEMLDDVVLLPCPVHPDRIADRLRDLRLWPVPEGVRGKPPLDVAALCDAAARLSWLAIDAGSTSISTRCSFDLRVPAPVAVDGRARLSAPG